MATTRKEGAPAKERATRSSLTPTTMQNPRARTTKSLSSPVTSSSGNDPAQQKKGVPNYLRPTHSSSLDSPKLVKAASTGTTKGPQKSLPAAKKVADAKPLAQRSSSFNPPRLQVKTALSSRSSFSDRTSKGKATHLSQKVESAWKGKPGGVSKGRRSTTSSASASTASSPKAATEDTLSIEDKEAALDILNLEIEEHVLLEIPPVVDKTPTDGSPIHDENPEDFSTFVEHEHVEDPVVPNVETAKYEQHDGVADDSEEGMKGDAVEEHGHEEVAPTEGDEEKEDAEKLGDLVEKAVVEGLGADGEAPPAAKADSDGEKEVAVVDGGGERVKLRVSGVEDQVAAKEKKKEAQQPQQGKKEAPPAYNDVIEETASKLVEKRKSKVKALVGAFETVIVMDSGGQAP